MGLARLPSLQNEPFQLLLNLSLSHLRLQRSPLLNIWHKADTRLLQVAKLHLVYVMCKVVEARTANETDCSLVEEQKRFRAKY